MLAVAVIPRSLPCTLTLIDRLGLNLSMAQLSRKGARDDGPHGRPPGRLVRSFPREHPWSLPF
jgi:hypothetical protein